MVYTLLVFHARVILIRPFTRYFGSNAIVPPVSLSYLTYLIPVLVIYVCVVIRQVALERKLKTC